MVPAVFSNSVLILSLLAGVYQSLRPVHLALHCAHHAIGVARTGRTHQPRKEREDDGAHPVARARRARAPRHHHHRRHVRARALRLSEQRSERTSENSRYAKFDFVRLRSTSPCYLNSLVTCSGASKSRIRRFTISGFSIGSASDVPGTTASWASGRARYIAAACSIATTSSSATRTSAGTGSSCLSCPRASGLSTSRAVNPAGHRRRPFTWWGSPIKVIQYYSGRVLY